ncbi:BQ2448_4201 [Microbotryum intermedium]|uniref:BQ2448_4201 protein n=1 Tax=Microbotryum intermedium TaxID=269621 RepID=A0A238FLB4_9BASI|nr:BQ2448_4201 [Microbotryum intermedium]
MVSFIIGDELCPSVDLRHPSANSEPSLHTERQLQSPASPRPAPRPRPTMPTVSAFASALFDESASAHLGEDVDAPGFSFTSPPTGAASHVSEQSHAFVPEAAWTASTEPSPSRWPGPRLRTLESTSLRPLHLDARPLRSLSSQVAHPPEAVGSIEARVARSSSTYQLGGTIVDTTNHPSASGSNVFTHEEPTASPTSVTLLRRAHTPGIPMATILTGNEPLFNLGNSSASSSTHYDSTELLTSTVTPWREFSAFRSSVYGAREAVEPLATIGGPNPSDLFVAGPAGQNETRTSAIDTSRLSDTQRVLRGAQQALRTAVAFAERLEQVTQSISSAISDHQASVGGSEAPTTRADRWPRARLSDGASTATTDARSSGMPPPAMLSLQRSIVQLRAASLRIDILLQEFPDFVGATAQDEPSPSASAGTEVSPEEHRARFYHYNTAPSTSLPSISGSIHTGNPSSSTNSASDNIEGRLELARSRLRHAQMTLDSMSRVRDRQDRYVQQHTQPGTAFGDAPTLMPAPAPQEAPQWEEARRARPEWQFLQMTPTLAQEQTATTTATATTATTPVPAPAPAPATMNPSLFARWRMSSQRSPTMRGAQSSSTVRSTRRAFPIKLDRDGVEIQDEMSGDEQSDQDEDAGPTYFIGGSFGLRDESRPQLRRMWSRELCGR